MTDQESEQGLGRRRARGDHSVYFDSTRQRFVAQATVGYDGRGKRIVRKGTGKSETAALRALRERIKEYEAGLVVGADRYTVKQAVEDWLELGHARTSARTLVKDRYLARHVIDHLGGRKVKELRPEEVERWLLMLAESMTNRTLADVRSVLSRSVKRAMSRGMVVRNVIDLVETPRGRAGRESRSMTMQQAADVLTLTAGHSMHAYIVVSLVTGLRTEEVRALRWDHVDLDGDPEAGVPPSVAVWRSVRMGGDTKTAKSRRTIALSGLAVAVLKRHRAAQTAARFRAGPRWQDSGLVFTSQVGTMLDASNVRDLFRDALGLVPGIEPGEWAPRDLRHSFASIMSERGVPLEEISRLLGHSGTAVTEAVYRKELRPVIQTGAQVMDVVFAHVEADPAWTMEPLISVHEAMGERGS